MGVKSANFVVIKKAIEDWALIWASLLHMINWATAIPGQISSNDKTHDYTKAQVWKTWFMTTWLWKLTSTTRGVKRWVMSKKSSCEGSGLQGLGSLDHEGSIEKFKRPGYE